MGGLVQPGTPARSPRLRPTSRVRGRPHRHLTPREPANPGPRNQLGTKPGVLQTSPTAPSCRGGTQIREPPDMPGRIKSLFSSESFPVQFLQSAFQPRRLFPNPAAGRIRHFPVEFLSNSPLSMSLLIASQSDLRAAGFVSPFGI